MVRGSLGLKNATNAEIDELHETFDKDGGGTLELTELRPWLKALHVAAVAAETHSSRLRRAAAESRQRAETIAHAKEMMGRVEEEEHKLVEMRTPASQPVPIRLARHMKTQRIAPESAARRFTANSEGNCDREALLKGVSSLLHDGVDVSAEQVEAWYLAEIAQEGQFNVMQVLRKGSLQVNEVLQEEKVIAKRVAMLRKEAQEVQETISAQDAEAAAKRWQMESEMAREKEEKAAAAAEAEMEKKRERRAERERRAAEKAAFDAKVEARREAQRQK